jgi:ATP-dependent DNA helicase Q4
LIYVSTRWDAETVSRYLNDKGQDATFYHAGMPGREKVQNQFMKNEVRILVCTVAFGMGINKLDIDAVIHYSVPKSIEDYIQQIGRAGRNGNDALCVLFYDQVDVQRQWSLAAADQIMENEIKSLIERFGQSVNVLTSLEQSTDLRMEVIETIMSRLVDFFEFETGFAKCQIRVFRMSTQLQDDYLKEAIKDNDRYTLHFETMNQYLIAEQDLKSWAAQGDIFVDFTEECIFSKIKEKPKSLFDLVIKIHNDLKLVQENIIYKVYSMAKVCIDALKDPKHNIFKQIQEYFDVSKPMIAKEKFYAPVDESMKKTIERDIKSVLSGSSIKNGKQIARILHGVSSPCFDVKVYSGQKCWKRYTNIDFDLLVELGVKILKEFK